MNIKPIKTRILHPPQDDLLEATAKSLKTVPEHSVVVVTSKAVSIWEGRCVLQRNATRETLMKQEADYYFPKTRLPVGEYQAAIKHGAFIASAGIDMSNSAEYFTLLPQCPNESAHRIWQWLLKTYGVKRCGVIITDSHLQPLRRGTVGISIGYYGFEPLTDYRGKPDLFGRPLKVTLRNLVDGFAAAAVVVMGEGSESTPLALITDIPFVRFLAGDYKPKKADAVLLVEPEKDVFYPVLRNAQWKKGGGLRQK